GEHNADGRGDPERGAGAARVKSILILRSRRRRRLEGWATSARGHPSRRGEAPLLRMRSQTKMPGLSRAFFVTPCALNTAGIAPDTHRRPTACSAAGGRPG